MVHTASGTSYEGSGTEHGYRFSRCSPVGQGG
jgi:hypothetical protein